MALNNMFSMLCERNNDERVWRTGLQACLIHPLMWQHSSSGGCTVTVFCSNIKSWRTTITLDSSIIILHLLHKSKRGGKALTKCFKLLTELMCQLRFFAVVTRSKTSKNQARGGSFLFLERLVTQLFYRRIFEKLVALLASRECLLDPRQN